MPADFQFYQTYGAAPGTDVAQGTGSASNDWDFKSNGTPGKAVGISDAIRAGDFSYHIYVRARFDQPASGVNWSSIDNIKYYGSQVNLSGYGTGAYIIGSGITTYAQPTATSKSGVWDPLPTTSASGIDIGTASLAGGTPGWTDWVGLQLKTGATGASAGFQPYSYFTLVWDEV